MKKLLLTIASAIFCVVAMIFFAYHIYLFFLGLSSGLTGHFDNYFGRMGGYGQLFFDILICLVNLAVFIISFLRGLVKKFPLYKILTHFGLLNISFIVFHYLVNIISKLTLDKTGSIITFYGSLAFIAVMWYCQMSLQFVKNIFKNESNEVLYEIQNRN